MIFRHGVASGDPLSDAVVIWTRVTTQDEPPVDWRVAADEQLHEVVASGTAVARKADDWTVSVDVRGLRPDARYWYAFTCKGQQSPLGRTITAPQGPAASLRMGVVSCAQWAAGYFGAYGHLADRDVDLVLHLGDYIYEGNPSTAPIIRRHEPDGIVSDLDGYRARYAQHRSDPQLQRLHARHPMVAIWDDHEFASDAWSGGSKSHDPRRHGDWATRVSAAARAYREWMPLRWPDATDPLRVYRSLRWGRLADLLLLDTRLIGRDEPLAATPRPVAVVRNRARSLLGGSQRTWLHDSLRRSDATWRVLGNQVMLAPLRVVRLPPSVRRHGHTLGLLAGGALVNPGQWDGFPDEREQLLGVLDGIDNVVVVTGDLHSSWAAEVTIDPRKSEPPRAVEFVTPSITSDSLALQLIPAVPGAKRFAERFVRWQNRHVRWVETAAHGYTVVDITAERVQADFWHVDRIDVPWSTERWAAGWFAAAGESRLHQARGPVASRQG